MMGFGGIFGILLIGVIVWAVIQFTNKNNSSDPFDTTRGKIARGEENALDILKRRYASGEITQEEYERVRQDVKQP